MTTTITKRSIGVCLSMIITLSSVFATVVTTANFDQFSNNIQGQLSRELTNGIRNEKSVLIRDIVRKPFCQTMDSIGSQQMPAYQDKTIYFNPKQSVFVHMICAGAGGTDDFPTIAAKKYFLKDNRAELGIFGNDKNICSALFGMNNCNIHKVATDIMQRIMNDMFDIRQAAVYAGITPTDMKKTEKINEYSIKVFAGFEVCPNDKCQYPKTQKQLESYMKRGAGLLQGLDIINRANVKEVVLKPKDIDCSFSLKETYNIFVCGFGSESRTSFDTFTLMIQNELFFYHLFLANYMGWIQHESKLLPLGSTAPNTVAAKKADIIADTQQQMAWTDDAVQLSMKTIREMYATFIIHIGLLIYYEDIYRLRQELGKVVTPMYTLYDKLRNVQAKD